MRVTVNVVGLAVAACCCCDRYEQWDKTSRLVVAVAVAVFGWPSSSGWLVAVVVFRVLIGVLIAVVGLVAVGWLLLAGCCCASVSDSPPVCSGC
jgi:hypothetical protein